MTFNTWYARTINESLMQRGVSKQPEKGKKKRRERFAIQSFDAPSNTRLMSGTKASQTNSCAAATAGPPSGALSSRKAA